MADNNATKDFKGVSEAANALGTPLEQFIDMTRSPDRQADFKSSILGLTHRILQRNEP